MHDDFFKVRVKLTLLYTLTAAVVITGYSLALYEILLSDFADSIRDRLYGLNPHIIDLIMTRTSDILKGRILIIDIAILSVIAIFSFFLTKKTLKPIRDNIHKQRRFVADASHEMRTPIAVVMSGLEVALRNKNLDISTARITLEETLDEMKNFSKLSTHLLDISRYDAGIYVEMVHIDVTDSIDSVVQKIKLLADDKKIELTSIIEHKGIILGNQIELHRVFFNLLHNAIKYTNSGGTVSVKGSRKNKKYVITIIDTGIGMEKDVVDKIFDPFFQNDKSRSGGGAGLGLTLTKRIVENHRGSIQIQSVLGQGTTVTVSFPLTSF